jgi:hypothetical protein
MMIKHPSFVNHKTLVDIEKQAKKLAKIAKKAEGKFTV